MGGKLLLRAKAQPNTGARNIHTLNLECRDSIHHYDIGPEPVEVPDADAKRILAMHGQIEVVQD
jgi:hypothetical protein